MKSIRTLSKFNRLIGDRKKIIVGIKLDSDKLDILKKYGFPDEISVGQRMLPKALGAKTRFNAIGKLGKRLKDKPKIPYFVDRYWEWKDYQGNEYSKVVSIQRMKYQRESIAPTSLEITISNMEQQLIAVTDSLNTSDQSTLISAINIFLEMFGDVELFDQNKLPILSNVKKLNWEILPKGELPWRNDLEVLKKLKRSASSNKRNICDFRLSEIEQHNPESVAIGRGGFTGYIVYCFPRAGFHILESLYYNNATYILGGNWELISQFTKKDILNENLHIDRIIHDGKWSSNVHKLFIDKAA
ncbi:hypothetical protein [Catenovulum agarivorans]|uniref:hypothetical protein n=1 Tax=Catenovulum agarivorans TaxID=1172192 RepID=UPI0002E6B768|nr:hypothetical protein [Catenovulum agarivorans]